MGSDYGVFIWSAYGVTAFAALALVLRAILDHRAQVSALSALGADPAMNDGAP